MESSDGLGGHFLPQKCHHDHLLNDWWFIEHGSLSAEACHHMGLIRVNNSCVTRLECLFTKESTLLMMKTWDAVRNLHWHVVQVVLGWHFWLDSLLSQTMKYSARQIIHCEGGASVESNHYWTQYHLTKQINLLSAQTPLPFGILKMFKKEYIYNYFPHKIKKSKCYWLLTRSNQRQK